MRKLKIKKLLAGISSVCVIASAMPVCPLVQASAAAVTLAGDANCDENVDINDAVLIMSHLANKSKYTITEQGQLNGDVYQKGDGLSIGDANSIQKYLAKMIKDLPESVIEVTPPAEDAAFIHLKNTAIETEGGNLTVDGNKVTITASGTYYVDGTLDDGQIIVDVVDEAADAETVKIFLNGVNITGLSAPAIYVENAENTSINLVEGTTNVLKDGTTAYAGEYLETAVIEAKDDITIKGEGTLEITANTQYAVQCNNDIKFTGGTVNIETLLEDAVRGKTSVTVKENAVINIDSEGDGIKSTKGDVAIEGGTIGIKAGNDAVQAETTIDISGGNVTACGDRGLTGVGGVNITGGTVLATATDNQTDSELLTATQTVMLLNCIEDPENAEDGCWKKANSIVVDDSLTFEPLKKYLYVLISDASIADGSVCDLKNGKTDAVVTHNNELDNVFAVKDTVNVFNTVNMNSSGGIVVAPSVTQPSESDAYTITLSSADIKTNAPAEIASAADGVCTIIQPGVFAVSGEMAEGQIVVNVDKTKFPEGVVELDLMGVNLTNTKDSPIYIAAIGDECQIVAKKGYENIISDGTNYTNADSGVGVIYACDDLKFKGSGTLTVNGKAEDAIVCKNDLKIYNGTIIVNAVDDAIRGKDSVTIGSDADTDFSTLSITAKSAAGDGIKSTETDTASDKGFITINGGRIDITAYSDGIHASQQLNILNGDITIETTCPASSGGSQGGWRPGSMGGASSTTTEVSAKGLKAGTTDDTTSAVIQGSIDIGGGKINITATDDAVHATNFTLTDGDITASSSDDGVHADTALVINGGKINVTKAYEGLEGTTIDVNAGTINITASDDGFNAAGGNDGSGNMNQGGWNPGGFSSSTGTLTFTGGYSFVRANGDVIDSNGDLYVNGGTVIACGPSSGGNGIFDKGDGNYKFTITGGTVIGMGVSDMAETPTTSGGTYLTGNSTLKPGTLISAADLSGNIVAVATVPADLSISNGLIQFYSARATSSTLLYSGGTFDGTLNADGYAESGKISGGTQLSTSSGNTGRPW